jgi:all-trans-retinol 13,14-reductase
MTRPDGDAWDAVVVGSGIGGLVCAAYLAVTGRRVLVLEQHDVAGGNTHVFRRRRSYEFDVGVHYLGDCGGDGLLPAILGGLGLRDRISFREMDADGFDLIELPSLGMAVPRGWDAYRRRLEETLPEEAAGIRTFTEVCERVAAEQRSMLLAPDAASIQAAATSAPATLEWGRQRLNRLFDHCGLSARARTVLAAQAPDYGVQPSVATVGTHAILIDHYLRGAYYPVGGGQLLAASLVEVLEAHGGELRTRCRVERILVEDGRTVGVALADGGVVRTDCVVSNADYRRTVLDLVGAEQFPAKLAERARTATMALPFATLYVALDTELPERPNANLWWYRAENIDEAFAAMADGDLDPVPFLFVSFASLKDPGSAACPPGHSNFQVMTLCPPSGPWWGVEQGPAEGGQYRRLEIYQKRKRHLTEAILAAAEEALGPFRHRITHLEMSTPVTHERYMLSSGGTPYGLAQWGRLSGARPDTATPIDGLHVVGTNTRYGSGIGGVAVGGIVCAGEILGERLMPRVYAGDVFGDPERLPERAAGWDPLAVSRGVGRRGARGLARLG